MGLIDPREPGMGLYLITDRKNTGDRDLAAVVEAALEGGARFIQLREKDLGGRELLELARRLRTLTA
ncbi:MAG TPA: thiamine phosphate synthase, partial [Gammaproteobacteria bacterium]|nr:thiamine phosphate synthase [Gammaproteobacteria bacterium]